MVLGTIVVVFSLCCRLLPKLEETAKVYRYRYIDIDIDIDIDI